MSRWRMWAGVLAVFACGLIIGGIGGGLYERYEAASRIKTMRSGGGQLLAEQALARLGRELDLNRDQIDQIRPLLLSAFDRVHQMHRALRPQSDQIMQETALRLKEHLTPPQRQKLDQAGEWKLLRSRPKPPG